MAGDDDLRLNTLHRFAKHSARLVLHEYSHCEVPAGCGGVVLRWVDPAKGAPATIRMFSTGTQGSCWLDGEPLASSLALLRAGPRLLAVHARRAKPGAQLFTVGVVYDEDQDTQLLAGAGVRWRCTTTPPAEGWAAPTYDDAAWQKVPSASKAHMAAQDSWVQRTFQEASEQGRPVIMQDTDELWLRVAFTAPEAP